MKFSVDFMDVHSSGEMVFECTLGLTHPNPSPFRWKGCGFAGACNFSMKVGRAQNLDVVAACNVATQRAFHLARLNGYINSDKYLQKHQEKPRP